MRKQRMKELIIVNPASSLTCRGYSITLLLIVIVGYQLLFIKYPISPSYQHVCNSIRSRKELLLGILCVSYSNKSTMKGHDGNLFINMVGSVRNFPYKAAYSDAELAFPKKRVPSSLLNWVPQEDSYKYWQPIGGHDAWMYSAYYDHQKAAIGRPMIRGFGLVRRPLPKKILFHFYGEKMENVTSKAGRVVALPADHHTMVVPVAYECQIESRFYPRMMSISLGNSFVLTNKFEIQYMRPRKRKFTVCYPAFHSNYNFTSQLIQSIQLNRILGAEHFFVYNFSISAQVDQILRHYQREGIMTVLQWPLPTIESWYLAQIVAVNDCAYRNRNISEFVVLVDTDEFIIPKNRYTWAELVNDLLNDSGLTHEDPDPDFEGITVSEYQSKILLSILIRKSNKQRQENQINKQSKSSVQQKKKLPQLVRTARQKSSLTSKDEQVREAPVSIRNRTTVASSKVLVNSTTCLFVKTAVTISNHLNAKPLFLNLPTEGNSPNLNSNSVISVQQAVDRDSRPVGSFVFRCAFFDHTTRQQWDIVKKNFSISKEEEYLIDQFSIQPLGACMRTIYIYPSRKRSKNIIRPELVYTMGIHIVHTHLPQFRNAYVKSSAGLLHHYRLFDPPCSQVVETTTMRYTTEFLRRLKTELAKFPQLFGHKLRECETCSSWYKPVMGVQDGHHSND